jgi:WD40 repeat protein
MSETAQPIISITTPNQSGHVDAVGAVAVVPDGLRMATSSDDKTIRLWNLKDGVVLKRMKGHGDRVRVAVSRDGQLIASGDNDRKLVVWNGDTGKYLTQVIKHIPMTSTRWTFPSLQMAQCWRLVLGKKRRTVASGKMSNTAGCHWK